MGMPIGVAIAGWWPRQLRLSHRLHRSLSPEARFRFVNYVHWDTVEHWQAAHDEGFRRLVSQPGWSPFTSTHALYEVVHEASAESSDGQAPAAQPRP